MVQSERAREEERESVRRHPSHTTLREREREEKYLLQG